MAEFVFVSKLFKKMYNKTIIELGFSHDIVNYQTLCLCYLPQFSASADNTDLCFDNSQYHAQPHPIIAYHHANKTHFHKKGFALGLVLRVRVFGNRKWPIEASLRSVSGLVNSVAPPFHPVSCKTKTTLESLQAGYMYLLWVLIGTCHIYLCSN